MRALRRFSVRCFTDRGTVRVTVLLARHKHSVTAISAALGLCLIAWAYFVGNPWGQGLLVNVGTALLLLAPLFVLNRALEEKVESLSQRVRDVGLAYAEGAALIPDPVERGAFYDELVDWFRESNSEPVTRAQVAELGRRSVPFRVIALDTMRADPELVDGELIRRGVVASESGNEQLYALDAALACWSHLEAGVRREIVECIDGDGEFSSHIWNDPARVDVARRIRALDRDPAAASRR
jgi:hypothetical protein